MGYSFSVIHALAYSFVGAQTLYLGTHWNPIYWDTACLVVNSGSLDDSILDEDGEELYDDNVEEEEEKQKRAISTDYGKTAKAVNEIIKAGINVDLIDINRSGFSFQPDVKNNKILFGMKALLNVNDELVTTIIANRPYYNIKDFYNRIKPKKQSMVSLIKAGAFDNMMDRKMAMGWFIWETCDKKSRLTLQNFPTLIKQNLVPQDTPERQISYKVYEFNRYLKAMCKSTNNNIKYKLDDRAIEFLFTLGFENLIEDNIFLDMKKWDKKYQEFMDVFREWLRNDGAQVLDELNARIFRADWEKYATGTLSAWEMEVLCFYKHDHELKQVNQDKFGLTSFKTLPSEPEIERTFYKGNKAINLFKLYRICGTCIAKNKQKSTVTILTPDGSVVPVKFRKDYYALFDKQISERGDDGKKHVAEKSWFNRGSMIMVQGIRSGDDFITKKYSSSVGHQLYHILNIDNNGDLILQNERYK